MDIGHENRIVAIYEHASARALREYIEDVGSRGLLLGNESSETNVYESVTFTYSHDRNESVYRIGLISEDLGTKPVLYLLPDTKFILLTFCWSAVKISLKEPQVVFQVDCEGLVYHSIHFPLLDTYVVIHELGAVCIAGTGKELWRRNARDVVENYWIEGDCVFLAISGGKKMRLRCK